MIETSGGRSVPENLRWFFADAILEVSKETGVPIAEIQSRAQSKPIREARQILWGVLRYAPLCRPGYCAIGTKKIGKLTGRDHTTVLAGLDRLAALASSHKVFSEDADRIALRLKQRGWRCDKVSAALALHFDARPQHIRQRPSVRMGGEPSPRDKAIVIAKRSQEKLVSIAREHGLSTKEVKEICERWKGWKESARKC